MVLDGIPRGFSGASKKRGPATVGGLCAAKKGRIIGVVKKETFKFKMGFWGLSVADFGDRPNG